MMTILNIKHSAKRGRDNGKGLIFVSFSRLGGTSLVFGHKNPDHVYSVPVFIKNLKKYF